MGAPIADPLAYHTDASRALSFSAAGPVTGRRWRLSGTQARDLRLRKTIKKSNRGVDTASNHVNVG
jgi:hypothetical protein